MALTVTQINQLYVSYFGRPADFQGVQFYQTANATPDQVAAAFAASAESQALFGSASVPSVINAIYQNLFNRDAEPAGLTYWTQQVQQGKVTAAAAALAIGNAAVGTDSTTVANKVLVANAFVAALDTTAEILGYSGDNAAAAARAFIKTVTATNLSTAQGQVDTQVALAVSNGGTTGQTFTLTTLVDSITGTAGNDTIIADNTGTNKQLTVADQINGGAGNDTLKVFLAAGDTATGQPTLTSIETVWINGGGISAYTAATGTTGLVIEAPVATALTVSGAGAVTGGNAFGTYTVAGQAVTLKDLKGTTVTSTGTAAGTATTYTTTIASTNDTALALTVNNLANTTRAATETTGNTTSNVSDTQTVDLSGGKFATLNLTATGANSTFVLTNSGGALRTLNIAGDKNVTISGSGAGALTKIDASAAGGAVSVDVSAAARTAAFTFTGGSGNDRVTLAAGDLALLSSGAQLDGGGGTDTLVIKDTTVNATALNAVKNFEMLGLGVTNSTIDAGALTSIKSFSIGVSGSTETINNLGAGSSVAITAATAAVNLGAAVGNTATDITLGTTTAAGFTSTNLTTTGLTTLSITSNGTSANTITTLANSDNSTITIKGANDLTITNALAATTTGSKVDASAFTGKLTVTGSGKADVIIGGSGADTIIGGAGDDIITGGAGADKFVLTNTTAGGMDWIKDFVAGTDKIYTTNNTTAATATLAIVDKGALSTTTFADLAAAVASFATGGANATTALQSYLFTYAGDNYLIVDNGTAGYAAGTDTLIKITGVTGTISTSDIINAT